MNTSPQVSDEFDSYLDDWNPTEDDLKAIDDISSRFWTGQTPPPAPIASPVPEAPSGETSNHPSALHKPVNDSGKVPARQVEDEIDHSVSQEAKGSDDQTARGDIVTSDLSSNGKDATSTRGRKRAPRTQSSRKGKAKGKAKEAESSTVALRPSPIHDIYRDVDPMSPLLRFRSHLRLSVTDLVTLAWCEVKFDYGLIGKRHLGTMMDDVVVSKHGRHVPVMKDIVKTSDKIMKKGEAVHKKLELELPLVEITVKVKTAEEKCGLELLNTLSNLKLLSTLGKCREMRVFGFVQGVFVTGIIDEIIRKPASTASPSPRGLYAFTSPPRTPRKKSKANPASGDTQLSHDYFALSPFKLNGEPNTPESPVTSPQRIRRNPPRAAKSRGRSANVEEPKISYRLHINDTKTRAQRSLPSDDLGGRLQLMIYRRLLLSLLIPTAPSTNSLDTMAGTESIFSFSFSTFFDYRRVDPTKLFSDQFIQQAQDLMPNSGNLRNLNDIVGCWWGIVEGLQLEMPDQFTKVHGEAYLGPVDPELELIYRTRAGSGTEKKRPGKRGRKGKKDVPISISEDDEGVTKTQKLEFLTEEEQISLALQESLKEAVERERMSMPVDEPMPTFVQDAEATKSPSPLPVASSSGTNSPGPDSIPPDIADRLEEAIVFSQGSAETEFERVLGDAFINDEELLSINISQEYDNASLECVAATSKDDVIVTSQEYVTAASQNDIIITSQEYVTAASQDDVIFTSQEYATAFESPLEVSFSDPKDLSEIKIKENAHPISILSNIWPTKDASDSELSSPTESLFDMGISVVNNFGQSDATITKQSSFGHPDIIGITRFKFDDSLLTKHVISALEYWTARREPVGVDLEDTWKCGVCEYREGCEWRSAQALAFSKGKQTE